MEQSFRERVAARLTRKFGPPVPIPTPDGMLYRWIIRTRSGDTLRITLDSPEFPDLAHLVVSDAKALPRVNSLTMRTLEELEAVIDQFQERIDR